MCQFGLRGAVLAGSVDERGLGVDTAGRLAGAQLRLLSKALLEMTLIFCRAAAEKNA